MKIIKQDMEIHIYHGRSWYIDWHKNKLCHREDGPATIWSDGDKYYCLNGKFY